LALLAALLAVPTMPSTVDVLAVLRAVVFEAARLGALRFLAVPPELLRRFALDPLELARGLVVRFAVPFEERFAVPFEERFAALFEERLALVADLRFAPLPDVRDAPAADRDWLFARAGVDFPFADFVPPELLLPEDLVDPLVRCAAVPDLLSAISHTPSSAIGCRRRATPLTLD
jgi:hypothetical protein